MFHFFHSLLAQEMCEMYFVKFHIKIVTSFIHKSFIIIFEMHMSKVALQYFLSKYITWICCSEFQGRNVQGTAVLTKNHNNK